MPPALPLTHALSQAVVVSEDAQEVFEADDSVTWEEEGGCCRLLPCAGLGVWQQHQVLEKPRVDPTVVGGKEPFPKSG